MNQDFDLAVESSGQPYLNFELDLRRDAQVDPSQAERLRKLAASHRDRVARLLAQVVLDWASPKGTDFKAALDYLDYIPNRFKRTAIGYPPPIGVEAHLTEQFGDRVAELLALRLVKQAGWAHWKIAAITLYLKAHRLFTTTSALLRFAIETDEAHWRELALEAIHEIHDPELDEKLAFEIARARIRGRTVPAEVRSLRG
jgi:hypothetical protein